MKTDVQTDIVSSFFLTFSILHAFSKITKLNTHRKFQNHKIVSMEFEIFKQKPRID